jgi:hypothetical protein
VPSIAIAREIGTEERNRLGQQAMAQAQSLGLSYAQDDTKPLPATRDASFDERLHGKAVIAFLDGARTASPLIASRGFAALSSNETAHALQPRPATEPALNRLAALL